jgi:cell division protein FtsW
MNSASLQFSRSAGRNTRFVFDPVVPAVTFALLLIGLVMVTSASVTIAERQSGDPFFYLERQLVSAILGLVGAFVMTKLPVEFWERNGPVLLVIAFVLLLVVLVPGIGHAVNGSRRWVRVGPVNFQPSELARVLLLMYLCGYIVRHQQELRSSMRGFFKPLAVLGAAGVLLLLEPDFGSTVVLLGTGVAVLFVAGARKRDTLLLAGTGAALLGLIAVSSEYRVRRLTAFLDPWADPFNSGFQLTQSLIAIGRGEWLGVGLGSSVQKLFYLPEAHTDFVFAVLAEEFGFVGVLVVVGLFLVLVMRALRISRLAAEAGMTFHACMAAAFGIWIGMQAFINVGVNMGLLPTKGLTLPLLSYGRSSMVVTLAWVGALLRIYHEVAVSGRIVLAPKRGAES